MSATGEVSGSARRGRRIILWRHGQTSWNVERRFQGSTDVELTETGVAQARRSARLLAGLKPDAIVASDLKRAAATAAELAALTGLHVVHEEALRETYAGVWQGLTHDEIIARYGEEYAAWKRGEPVRRGGGELTGDRGRRPRRPLVLRHAEKLPENGTLVVVSHGGTIRTTIGLGCSASTRAAGRAWAGSPTAAGPSSARAPGAGGCWSTTPAPCRSRCSATTTETAAPAAAPAAVPPRASGGGRTKRLTARLHGVPDPDFTFRQVAG